MIACLYEGSAERAILDILYENNFLSFSKDDLLSGDFIRRVPGSVFCTRYLSFGMKDAHITIMHVQDSRKEKFNIPKAYLKRVASDIRYITNPEIEILVILAEGKNNDFKKCKLKPSIYCKEKLHLKDVKNYEHMRTYFADSDKLLKSIKLHKMYYGGDIKTLYDLLSDEAKKKAESLI